MQRLSEELEKLREIIEQVSDQRDTAIAQRDWARKEQTLLQNRLLALGKEKCLLVVWEPSQMPQIALDGPWVMADIKRLFRSLGLAVRMHHDEIRRQVLTRKGRQAGVITKPTACPEALIAATTDPPPEPLPEEEEPEIEEKAIEEAAPPDEEAVEPEPEEPAKEPEPEQKEPPGGAIWIEPPKATPDSTKARLEALRQRKKKERLVQHKAQVAAKKQVTQSEAHLETPGRLGR